MAAALLFALSVLAVLLARRAQARRVEAEEQARLFRTSESERVAAQALAERLRVAEERRAFLADASRVLGASLEYERTLESLTRQCVPFLADYASVDVVTEEGDIRRVGTAHRDPAKEELLRDVWRRYPYRADHNVGVPQAIRSREPLLVPEFKQGAVAAFARNEEHLALLERLGPRSYICVPLVARGRAFGALSLVMSDSGRRFTRAELDLALDLGQRAAVAIDHARLYQEAQRANRAKTEFLATMSHELRTPLNAIGGYAELLVMGIRGPITDAQREDLVRIQRNQRHLLSLVNDVLNFARIDSGKVHYEIADVAVNDALAGVETLIAPQVEAKGLEYRYTPAADDVVARVDREKLQQIVLNLLSNAVKFTPVGGRIALDASAQDSVVTVRVADSGRGIPSDQLEAIFEPFVQVDRGLTRASEGTGLGLAISRELARAMRGDLRAESRVGEGSTFTLTLPRAQARPGAGET